MRKPCVSLRERAGVHVGAIDLPMRGGNIRVQTLGWNPMSALRRASSAALKIATDPALAPFMPPQVTLAVQVARGLSKLSPEGLKEAAISATDVATRKLAKELLRKQRRQQAIEEREEREAEMDAARENEVGAEIGARGRTRGTARGAPRGRKRGMPGRTPGGSTRYQTPYETTRPNAAITSYSVTPGWGQSDPYAAYEAQPYPDAYQQPPPPPQPGYDQYGNPIPNYPGYGQMPGMDQMAMQAWGAEAYDRPAELEPDAYAADEFFEAYEDHHNFDDDAYDVPGAEPIEEEDEE